MLSLCLAAPAYGQSERSFWGAISDLSYGDGNVTGVELGAGARIQPDLEISGSYAVFEAMPGDDLRNITLRGSRHIGTNGWIGLFFSADTGPDLFDRTTGVEFGYGSKLGRIDAYYGSTQSTTFAPEITLTMGGLAGEIRLRERVFLTLQTDAFDQNDTSLTERFSAASVGTRVAVADRASLYARYGTTTHETVLDGRITSDVVRDYISIGARINFGPTTDLGLRPRSQIAASGY